MTETPARILVVDDEMPIRMTMGDILRRRGYDIVTAASGEEALEQLHLRPFDLLLLDLRLPGLNGLEVARQAQDVQPDAAVIILTGHGSLESAVDGIHIGIFDYLLKTSSPQQVVARVAAALTRQQEERRRKHLLQTLQAVASELGGGKVEAPPQPTPNEGWITVGDLQISTWRQQVRRGDEILNLTPTEFRVLLCLGQQAGNVMTYQQLVQCAQGYEADALEAADLIKPHIYHLRQKVEVDLSNPQYILTVRGSGYMLTANPRSTKS